MSKNDYARRMASTVANAQRLSVMLEQRAAGWSHARIGAFHGICVSRVGQIVRRAETRRLLAKIRDTPEI